MVSALSVSWLTDLLIREGYNVQDITGRNSGIFIIMVERLVDLGGI